MNEDKQFEEVLAPLSLRVADLRDLWLSSQRGRPEAIEHLSSLLQRYPELELVISHIESISKAMFKKNKSKKSGKASKPSPVLGSWERLREKSGTSTTRTSPLQGGLPSLRKR